MTADDLHAIRDRIAAIRQTQADIMAQAQAAAIDAAAEGMSERSIAEALGVARMTVRGWLGRSVS